MVVDTVTTKSPVDAPRGEARLPVLTVLRAGEGGGALLADFGSDGRGAGLTAAPRQVGVMERSKSQWGLYLNATTANIQNNYVEPINTTVNYLAYFAGVRARSLAKLPPRGLIPSPPPLPLP